MLTPYDQRRQCGIYVYTIIDFPCWGEHIEITFDPAKREATLGERGLDFLDAPAVFDDVTIDQEDDRFDYGEVRTITVGYLANRMVVLVWTQRGSARHIISMRKANSREQAKYKARLGRS